MSDIKNAFFRALAKPLIILSALTLSACSMTISKPEEKQARAIPYDVQVQSMRTTPEAGSKIIVTTDLEPGDILLSRDFNIVSLGIRMFTASSVSHAALYIGDNQVAEAVGSGIRITDLKELSDRSLMVAAYRYPNLTALDKVKIREFAYLQQGNDYNFRGIVLTVPFTIARQVCELTPISEENRNKCLHNLASAQFGDKAESDSSFFCSEFVVAAYNYAGHPITDAAPIWISPDDLMHMREGDIKSMSSHKELIYVGHLKTWSLKNAFL